MAGFYHRSFALRAVLFQVPMRLAILIAAIALIAPAGAAAAVLEPLKPCYVSVHSGQREPIEVRASGFTPGSRVDVAIDGAVVARDIEVDPAGSLTGRVAAPFQAAGERAFALSVAEQGTAANAVSATSMVSALKVQVRPRRAPSSSRVRFSGRGFTAARPIFGHYLYGGQVRKTVRFGAPEGPCGTFSVERRQIPIPSPRVGEWTLQVDQQRRYSPQPAGVAVPVTIRVERVVR
jgi:hypothetical protein